ncbi:ESX secretion-associated protein EspG [Rhodococcus sp. 14-2470-1a]|uniref:ESX secretion-associated protein EspG n=1 Tax=Rhodococcus sp. 14-2470-1a TaxID=2023150 RepID=UPI000B9B2B58|nr:ESX secretion-associated protein EspG [Rhodococcus sp. 14-2470-1a]OZF50146.1 ESX secretion-associated protein EspG [Rhodococcus sp. 14-2470-1a]
MTLRHWTLDGLVFRMLLEQSGRDRLPFPVQHRPMADSAADYHRRRHEATTAALEILDEDLRFAIRTIVEPVVRVELVGHVRTGDTEHTKLRAHAAVGHDVAVVLTQAPGIDDRSGGDITLETMEPFRGVRAVVDVLPNVERGTGPRIDVSRPATEGDTERSPLLQSMSRTSNDDRYERLFSRPPSSAGEILVCAGPAPDSRLTEGTTGVQWVDFAGDGRYMIRHTSIISVIPVSVSELVAEVRGLVGKATAVR